MIDKESHGIEAVVDTDDAYEVPFAMQIIRVVDIAIALSPFEFIFFILAHSIKLNLTLLNLHFFEV